MACWNSFERLPIFRRLSRTHKEKIMKKHVYQFGPGGADGDGTMKDVRGGKGAGLAEMCRANLPVPPGFTISTEVCNIYFENQNTVPDEIHKEMLQALEKLQKQMGQTLGDTENPLLKYCVLDLDIWWHLKVGDWILANRAVPHTGILSRTAATRSDERRVGKEG